MCVLSVSEPAHDGSVITYIPSHAHTSQLDDELDTGVSGPSDTFGNTRLSSRHIFKCLSIEIWGFEMGGVDVVM